MTKQTKIGFTPGPWHIREYNGFKRYIEDSHGVLICDTKIHTNLGNKDNHEANALLISKAPEMYEALKELLNAYTSIMHSEFDGNIKWEEDKVCKQVKSILKEIDQ